MDLPSSNTPLAKYGTVFTNAKVILSYPHK